MRQRRRTNFTHTGRRGIATADVMVGILILAALTASVIVTMNRTRLASARLADARGATWAAEAALTQLQTGKPVEQSDDVKVEKVYAESAPPNQTWVRVRAKWNGRSATLIGLVPSGAAHTADQGGAP